MKDILLIIMEYVNYVSLIVDYVLIKMYVSLVILDMYYHLLMDNAQINVKKVNIKQHHLLMVVNNVNLVCHHVKHVFHKLNVLLVNKVISLIQNNSHVVLHAQLAHILINQEHVKTVNLIVISVIQNNVLNALKDIIYKMVNVFKNVNLFII